MSKYKRKNLAFNMALAKRADEIRALTSVTLNEQIVIGEDGDVTMVDSELAHVVGEALGTVVVRRASHVVPANPVLRGVFKTIRRVVGDGGRIAEWTRGWDCLWVVQIIEGPPLKGTWISRKAAIVAEVQWLNRHFADSR